PQGVTALGLLAESHISIHTWPETGYAAADVFTCGIHCDPKRAGIYLSEALQSKRHTFTILQRGKEALANIVAFPCREDHVEEESCIRANHHPPYG
ncbi:MAG: adenosylmethionine decarboxylase, partial [Desulfosarcinaceae bacterium]